MNSLFKIYFLFFGLAFISCKKAKTEEIIPVSNDPLIGCTDAIAQNFKSTAKTDDCSCQYNFATTLNSKAPADFTQKILIEEHSGTWCGWCPISKETMEMVILNKNVVGVEVHIDDKLTLLDEVYTPIRKAFGTSTIPSAMVNRKKSVVGTTIYMSDAEWDANIKEILKTPKTFVGLSLETKITGSDLELMTFTKFNITSNDKFGLGIYLVENNVTGYPQLNYLYKNVQFKQYKAYSQPSEIPDMKHYNVNRAAIAPIISGAIIPVEASGKLTVYKKYFKTKLPSNIINIDNCSVIAFVMNSKNEIINVNYCKVGEKVAWD